MKDKICKTENCDSNINPAINGRISEYCNTCMKAYKQGYLKGYAAGVYGSKTK